MTSNPKINGRHRRMRRRTANNWPVTPAKRTVCCSSSCGNVLPWIGKRPSYWHRPQSRCERFMRIFCEPSNMMRRDFREAFTTWFNAPMSFPRKSKRRGYVREIRGSPSPDLRRNRGFSLIPFYRMMKGSSLARIFPPSQKKGDPLPNCNPPARMQRSLTGPKRGSLSSIFATSVKHFISPCGCSRGRIKMSKVSPGCLKRLPSYSRSRQRCLFCLQVCRDLGTRRLAPFF